MAVSSNPLAGATLGMTLTLILTLAKARGQKGTAQRIDINNPQHNKR